MQKKFSPEAFALWKAKHASTCEATQLAWSMRVLFVCGVSRGAWPLPLLCTHGEGGCLNHVSKRLGTFLRKLKAGLKVDNTTKEGKPIRSLLAWKDRLTDKEIDKQQSYFAINIRSHETVKTMKLGIMGLFYHACSSDDHPTHRFCPDSQDSWCLVRRPRPLWWRQHLITPRNCTCIL